MFEEMNRELRRLGCSPEISVTIPSDEEGYSDRECPSAECLFQFKIHEEDWQGKVRDEMFCPFCGHTADSDKWWTPQQVAYMEKAVLGHIEQSLGRAMKRDADRWNRRQPRNSFLRITMDVENRPRLPLLPLAAAEAMQLKITCPECACRYAVIGAAFFCPACGHNAAELVFSQSLTGIRNSLVALVAIRAAIPDRDTAETTARLIIENGLQNAVTAFQRYAEALYAKHQTAPKARRNAFQNLAEGSDLWHAAIGKRYSDHLTTAELATLARAFQQRHVLAHRQGLVDQDYITRSGDTAYRLGQRLVIHEATVRECLNLIEKLASGMRADVRGAP